MKIAVTGGMGFIGTELVDYLIRCGHSVAIVDFWKKILERNQLYARANENENRKVNNKIFNNLKNAYEVYEPDEFLKKCHEYDSIVHLGACTDTQIADDYLFNNNFKYVDDLLLALSSKSYKRLIFISSASVYGNSGSPENVYALSKAIGESKVKKWCKSSITNEAVCFRLFNVFGNSEYHKDRMASVPFKINKSFNRGDKFELFNPESRRDFVAVSVVVDTIYKSLTGDFAKPTNDCKIYDVGMGESYSFEFIANKIKSFNGSARIKCVDAPKNLIGYQHNTCAGKNGVENAAKPEYDIECYLEEYYSENT